MKKLMIPTFRYRICLCLVIYLFLFGSCNKDNLLNPVPQTSVSESVAFGTPERILGLVNGLYAAVKNGQFYGGRYLVYQDIRGEDFLNQSNVTGSGLQIWNHTLDASTLEINNLWISIYYAVNSANLVIEGIENNRAVLVDDRLSNNYIAEARFIRALCYHSLLSLYSRPFLDGNGNRPGVPLRLNGERSGSNNDLARSSVGEVYAQVLDDLDFAEQNLPSTYNDDILNATRAHVNTAIALKTRVLLAMGRYADVIHEADKLVPPAPPFVTPNGVIHLLDTDIKQVFSPPYTSSERIFSMPFTETDLPGVQNGLGSYYDPGPRGIGDYSLNPEGIISELSFTSNDTRRTFIIEASGLFYLNKFPTGPLHLDYVPVIRYAEVLLNLAEAIARTSELDERAIVLLNAVSGRSDPSRQFSKSDFTGSQDLIEAILLERRMELLGEGFRSLDCTRLLLPIPGKANIGSVEPSQSGYIWPIPQTELATNKLCTQN